MGKRPFLEMAVGFILGISIAVYWKTWMIWLGVFGILMWTVILTGHDRELPENGRYPVWKRRCCMTILVATAFFLGWHHCRSAQAKENQYLPDLVDGEEILLKGKLAGKERKNEQYLYYMSSCQIGQDLKIREWQSISANVIIYCESDTYPIGQTLVLHGKIKLFNRARNEGNFDQAAYYKARGIAFAVNQVNVRNVYGKEDCIAETMYEWKYHLAAVYERALGAREGGVLNTMLLGEKNLLDAEIKQLYRNSGISHILAISGLHIAVIGMTLYRLMRKERLGFWGAGFIAAVLMITYGMMTGMGYSLCRAVSMFCIFLLAQAVGRSYDSLNALGFAALLILWKQPFALYDAGFQFSFAAVSGVVWAGKIVQNTYQGHAVLQKIGMGFVLQLVILPVTAWYFYEIPVYAMLLNLIVLPFIGVALASGIAGGVLGSAAIPKMTLVRIALLPCHLILNGYEKICTIASGLPNALLITGKPSAVRITIYYLLLAAGLFLLSHRTKHQKKARRVSVKNRKQKIGKRYLGKVGMPFISGFCLLAFLFIKLPQGMKLVVLDVGQGDGIYLHTDSGYDIFIDGGSTDVQSVGKYRILPYLKANGVKQMDYWFVSHTDQDHISGLLELFGEGYGIRNLVFFRGMVPDRNYEKLISLAREHGTKVHTMSRKEALFLESAKIMAISPEYHAGDEKRSETGTDKNEESLVLLYEEKEFSALFTGDIGEKQEKQILKWRGVNNIDFYKAAHHGSKYSNTKGFLDEVSPRISVISCAKKNRYGHPGKEAVENITDTGSALFYTMEDGQITVAFTKKNALAVKKYLVPDKQFVFVR